MGEYELWVGGQTNTQKKKQTDGHIDNMTQSGLGAKWKRSTKASKSFLFHFQYFDRTDLYSLSTAIWSYSQFTIIWPL